MGTQSTPPGLAWERYEGAPEGVGICLSGGGLRAASFALGVLQTLQTTRGLLWGPSAARFLSAVSGGSYVAATLAVNARRMSDDAHPGTAGSLPPLAAGSPEEKHILDNGMYLAPHPTMLVRFALLILANLAALIVLFVWTGTMLGDIGVVSASTSGLRAVVDDLVTEPLPVAVIGVVVSVLVVIGGLYSVSLLARYALTFVGALGIFATAEPALRGLDANQWLSHDRSWLILSGAGLALMTTRRRSA